MPKTPGQKAAIKKREKLAKYADPMAAPEAHAPKEGTQTRFFWEYGQAFSRGISKATGRPSTPPTVAGPTSIMVQLLRTHCRDESGKLLSGSAVLEWIENVVHDFRLYAGERDYGRGPSRWSPSAFARWLDNGRPKASNVRDPRVEQAAERRAHIAIRKG